MEMILGFLVLALYGALCISAVAGVLKLLGDLFK